MKPLTITTLNLIEKALGMTGSANDHEAAAAIRKVNTILKDHDITWAQLLRKQVQTAYTMSEPEAAGASVQEATDRAVQTALDSLRGRDLGKVTDFIASLDKQWAEKKYLSPAQRKPLFEIHRNNAS